MDTIRVVNPGTVPSMVYEYETLGQEIFTYQYENGLGLIKVVFPINRILLHQHPYPPGSNPYKRTGPGNIYVVWAVQLPWIESEIDEKNIPGSEKLIKYLGTQIPRELWKTKEDFKRAIHNLTEGINHKSRK